MSILIPFDRLSPEQKEIIRDVSTSNNSLFVEGPPGAGKTLISLYVLKDIATQQNIRPLLMMYNNSLYGFLIASLNELNISDNVIITTKDRFFWAMAREHGIRYDSNLEYDEKYKYILNNLSNVEIKKEYDITLVDEVQDMQPEEFELIKKMSHKVISLGDFNQGIYSTNINKETVKQNGVYKFLEVIHRFHKKIAKISNIFSSNGDDLEKRVKSDSSTQPLLIDTTYDNELQEIGNILNDLKRENKSIGVICPDRKRLRCLSSYLQQKDIKHSFYWKNTDLRSHDFTSNDPLLIPCLSSKGLEFEKVILFGFDSTSWAVRNLRSDNRLKSTIFVGITRTKSDLFIIRNEYTIQEIDDLKVEVEIGRGAVSIEDIF